MSNLIEQFGAVLAVFRWGWLWEFAMIGMIAVAVAGLIVLVVWLTGGLGGESRGSGGQGSSSADE